MPQLPEGGLLDESFKEGVRARPRRCKTQRSTFAFDDEDEAVEDDSVSPHTTSRTAADDSSTAHAMRKAVSAFVDASLPSSAPAPSPHAASSLPRRPTPADGSITGNHTERSSQPPVQLANGSMAAQHSAPMQGGQPPHALPARAAAVPGDAQFELAQHAVQQAQTPQGLQADAYSYAHVQPQPAALPPQPQPLPPRQHLLPPRPPQHHARPPPMPQQPQEQKAPPQQRQLQQQQQQLQQPPPQPASRQSQQPMQQPQQDQQHLAQSKGSALGSGSLPFLIVRTASCLPCN